MFPNHGFRFQLQKAALGSFQLSQRSFSNAPLRSLNETGVSADFFRTVMSFLLALIQLSFKRRVVLTHTNGAAVVYGEYCFSRKRQ